MSNDNSCCPPASSFILFLLCISCARLWHLHRRHLQPFAARLTHSQILSFSKLRSDLWDQPLTAGTVALIGPALINNTGFASYSFVHSHSFQSLESVVCRICDLSARRPVVCVFKEKRLKAATGSIPIPKHCAISSARYMVSISAVS